MDRRALFAKSMGPRTAPASARIDPHERRRFARRLHELEDSEPLSGIDLRGLLAQHGIGRRAFLEWASGLTAMLMLSPLYEPMVARAAEVMNRLPVIWIEGQSCRGNSEALLRSEAPTVDELLFETISLEFHQLIMAASGFQADQRKAAAVKANRGKYLLIVEGAIPTGAGGAYSTTGARAIPFIDELRDLSRDAAAVIAVGSCATYAALPEADPNPTQAVSVQDVITNKPLINLPACPINPVNFVGTLVHFTLTGQLPALDSQLRPKWAFGALIHDNCPRRAHFDAGEYVEAWGDTAARNGFCLYKMGCKGPMTSNNCASVLYNGGTSWPIGAGHGCIGCSEEDFWDRLAYERPLSQANVGAPGLFGWGVENSVDKFGLGLLTLAAAGIAAHAIASGVAHVHNRGAQPVAPQPGSAPAPAAHGSSEQDLQISTELPLADRPPAASEDAPAPPQPPPETDSR
jgi:quinone-reactive Ni/Fe-hydrogenase small subunit